MSMGALVGAYHAWISRYRLQSMINTLEMALMYARESAITLHTTTIFCGSRDHQHCDQAWQQGQLILDEQTNQWLRVFPSMPAGYHLLWRSTLGDSTQLRFRWDGLTQGQQGSFFICGPQNALSAQLLVLRTARMRTVIGYLPLCQS